jgi:uncharacterized damage-inducible protein DinB
MKSDDVEATLSAGSEHSTSETEIARAFLAESRRVLIEDHLPRIEHCVELLSDEEIWWRPTPESNSVGNLMLHLAGNIRQYIVSGVGGEPDRRDRQAEFDERGPLPRAEVIGRLRRAVFDSGDTLERVDPASLLVRRIVQGHEVTGLFAIYHAVEHFSMHTGQIIFITKMKRGDLAFYEVNDGIPRRRWAGLSDR